MTAERIVLLKHILKTTPVAILRESTKEVQAAPAGIDEYASIHLKEIYRLRDKQEQFDRGEIGE